MDEAKQPPRFECLLQPSEEFFAVADKVLETERRLLEQNGIPGVLLLVGGTSVAGALTKGDIDLHLRVPASQYDDAVATLRTLHQVMHPEIWSASLATFEIAADVAAGLAVTPEGSAHDVRFTRTWDILRIRPDLVQEYNRVKQAFAGSAEYEAQKSDFFDRVLADDASSGK